MSDAEPPAVDGALDRAGAMFLTEYLARGGPSLGKRDVDLLIFHSLETAGVIESTASDFEIANRLRITPARARLLRRDAQIRWGEARQGLTIDEFRRVLQDIDASEFSKGNPYVRLRCRHPYLAHLVEAELTEFGLYPDYERNRAVLRMHVAGIFVLARRLEAETDSVVEAIQAAVKRAGGAEKLTREGLLKRALARVRGAGDLAGSATNLATVLAEVAKLFT